jgi:hypothetical protein
MLKNKASINSLFSTFCPIRTENQLNSFFKLAELAPNWYVFCKFGKRIKAMSSSRHCHSALKMIR